MNQRFCNGMVHVIKEGETLYQLSRMYRVPVALLLRANPYVDVYNLQVGQEICIPVGRPAFPGMMPPFGRPPRRNMSAAPMQERTNNTENSVMQGENDGMENRAGMRESSGEEQMEEMRREADGDMQPPMMENITMPEPETVEDGTMEEEPPYLIMDGRTSLGGVLREENLSLSDFMEMNDVDELILARDVRIYLPKRV